VVTRLACSAEPMTEHEAEGRFQHRLICLLKGGLFVESRKRSI
jgi:hypothetical protein